LSRRHPRRGRVRSTDGPDPGTQAGRGDLSLGRRRERSPAVRRWSMVPTRTEAIAAGAASQLFAVSFPPFLLFVPAFLCLTPLAVAVAREADAGGSPRAAARLGFWFGLLGYACALYWIAIALSLYTKLAILGYIGAIVWLAPIVALAMAALFALRRG